MESGATSDPHVDGGGGLFDGGGVHDVGGGLHCAWDVSHHQPP